jgi:hypothetical protein
MDGAIAVLRGAANRAEEGPQTGADIRLALKALRFVGIPAGDVIFGGIAQEVD